jgi:hypothetical protein
MKAYNVELSDEQTDKSDDGDKNVTTNRIIIGTTALGKVMETWGQCYLTFYYRKLRIFVIS